jgi:hypothetical protein
MQIMRKALAASIPFYFEALLHNGLGFRPPQYYTGY